MSTAVDIKMSVGTSIILCSILEKIISEEKVDASGNIQTVTRDLPTTFQYKLIRNKALLEKDVKAFNEKRLQLLALHGKMTEDGENVIISSPEEAEKYKNGIGALLDTEVNHTVLKFERKDFEDMNKDLHLNLTEEAIKLLLSYLVDDKDFLEDYSREIHFKQYTPPEISKEEPKEEVKEEKTEEKKLKTKKAKKEAKEVEKVSKETKKVSSKKVPKKKLKE